MMNIPADCIRLFPKYEAVFYDELEMHQRYFLPVCSVNLRFLMPEKDEWHHFISVKEIYDGCVGEMTTDWHTRYTKPDTFGFDVIDGKYRFDADWRYFTVDTIITPEDYGKTYDEHEIEYNMNDSMYALKKQYYEQYGALYDGDFNCPGLQVDDIRRLERLRLLRPEDLHKDAITEYALELRSRLIGGVLTDLLDQNPDKDDVEPPLKDNGAAFDYIGCMPGYDFQLHGADQISLFYDGEGKKAVVTLSYT
ncbi:hypothetical protein [Chitinophaga nivalis]|uniref:Uncharacterized protein n=1 Tax=Chitinophaga nivalis TaxID=2991709 RepID=A0ABT3IPL3_9BACT|nr:hypothetical protein [Chitinophaga nivalis]MCW3464396.1 hypothetical protein [Chitinophaga nivalis]MCW3485913.1 hypothetical protein [Chitinophaga nivalis]